MLNIYTCIIFGIVFSDLVSHLYFYDTDTWDSCDSIILTTWCSWTYHVILSCDLVFLWFYDYVTRQFLIHDISCSLYTCHTMHARTSCAWLSSQLFLLLLLLSVFDTANIVLISMSYLYCYCIFIFSLLLFFSLRVLLLVSFWQTIIIFQYFIYVILSLRLVVYAFMCAILLVVDNLRYSWKRFHSSWVSIGHRHVPILHILGSGAWQYRFWRFCKIVQKNFRKSKILKKQY